MNLILKEVTAENWEECIELALHRKTCLISLYRSFS